MWISSNLLKLTIYFVRSCCQLCRVFDLRPLSYLEHWMMLPSDAAVPICYVTLLPVDAVRITTAVKQFFWPWSTTFNNLKCEGWRISWSVGTSVIAGSAMENCL